MAGFSNPALLHKPQESGLVVRHGRVPAHAVARAGDPQQFHLGRAGVPQGVGHFAGYHVIPLAVDQQDGNTGTAQGIQGRALLHIQAAEQPGAQPRELPGGKLGIMPAAHGVPEDILRGVVAAVGDDALHLGRQGQV